jgi:hypothetical protein
MAKREAVLESKRDSDFTHAGKYADIERENRILLDKMSNIMQDNKPKLYNPSKILLSSFLAERFEVPSLNRDARKKSLMKITAEN